MAHAGGPSTQLNSSTVENDSQAALTNHQHGAPTLYVCFNVTSRGDHNLRSSYGERMMSLMQQLPSAQAPGDVKAVLDLGCATGLSSLALTQLFPAAKVTGVDLSPHMVAVGRYHQERREVGVLPPAALAGHGGAGL